VQILSRTTRAVLPDPVGLFRLNPISLTRSPLATPPQFVASNSVTWRTLRLGRYSIMYQRIPPAPPVLLICKNNTVRYRIGKIKSVRYPT
jgi:hypothetical protein